MSPAGNGPVVVDTMVVSARVNASGDRSPADEYRALIGGRSIVVSFGSVTELRYGAIQAGWGELRRRSLERDLGRFVVVRPDDRLMSICAELGATCEALGHPLGQKVHNADRWIASTAPRVDIDLVSDDGVFRTVERLDVLARGT